MRRVLPLFQCFPVRATVPLSCSCPGQAVPRAATPCMIAAPGHSSSGGSPLVCATAPVPRPRCRSSLSRRAPTFAPHLNHAFAHRLNPAFTPSFTPALHIWPPIAPVRGLILGKQPHLGWMAGPVVPWPRVSWSRGLVVSWSRGLVASWSRGPLVMWPRVPWPDGPAALCP